MLDGLYGERHIRAIIGAAGERVDAAVVDPNAWGDVISLLVDAFPEACVSWAFHARDGRVKTVPGGWEPNAIASYEAHYASVNPFAPFWAALPCNQTVVAGRNAAPIGAFANTEFVADWLDPQGDLRGATGVRLGRTTDEVVTFVSTHYPTKRMGRYDTALSSVIEALSERMSTVQSVLGTAVLAGERSVDRAAILARAPGAAIVVTADAAAREMCPVAAALADEGRFIRLERRAHGGDHVSFDDPAIQQWFEATLARSCSGMAVDCDRTFVTPNGPIRLRLTRMPAIFEGAMADAFGARRTLVVIDAPDPLGP